MPSRLRSMFAQPGFAVLLFLIGLLVINWPFAEVARRAGDFAFFIYFFSFWAGAILLAFLVSRAVSDQEAGEDSDV